MAALRVATFNVRNGLAWDGCSSWPFRRRCLADTIRDLSGDLLGLQEVFWFQRRYLTRRLAGYAFFGRGRDRLGWGEACPVVYRTDRLELLEGETLWLSPTPSVPGSTWPGTGIPRVVTRGVLRDREQGGVFGVLNTHLDHKRAELRRRSVELVMAPETGWIDRALPWIVMGDLNAPPDDPGLAPLFDGGLRDVLGGLPPRGTGAATYHGFTGTLDGERIDYLLLSAGWSLGGAGIARGAGAPCLASDHWPVIAEVESPARQRPA